MYVTGLLPHKWTNFDEIFSMCSDGFQNGLDSQFGRLENHFHNFRPGQVDNQNLTKMLGNLKLGFGGSRPATF